MMKKIFRFVLPLLCLISVLCGTVNAYAEGSDYPYVITSYDVDMTVNEDNTMLVTETIDCWFNEERHGIYRYIPTTNYVSRADGTERMAFAEVRDVESNATIHDTYTNDESFVIVLGDEDKMVVGNVRYVIKYRYAVSGMDHLDNCDELYYNIIGDGWETAIQNVTFNITMPKDFDAEKIGFSTGAYGDEGTDIIDYTVDGNTISGRTTFPLDEYEGVTMRVELPDGYFTFDKSPYFSRAIGMMIPAVVALCVVIILWLRYGRDKRIENSVQYYPPENMCCAEVAYWYKGRMDPHDCVPMLIELANEGCIRIIPCDLKTDHFKIEKVRNYGGHNANLRRFYKGLFKGRVSTAVPVYESDLKNSFYTTVREIMENIIRVNEKKVYVIKSLTMRRVGWITCAICAVAEFFFGALMFENRTMTYFTETLLNGAFIEKIDIVSGFVAIALCGVAAVIAIFISQRTEDGHQMKERIKGFKNFLETEQKERLEKYVEENPTYYYDILPFAYVLGVSDKWTKKFESIAMEPPRWLSGVGHYEHRWFHHYIHGSIHSAAHTMTSTPPGQSLGGYSGTGSGGSSVGGGGGFSGGGFGGGGGGSW